MHEDQLQTVEGMEMLGTSTAMQAVKSLIEKTSSSWLAVLLQGETGVGKGVVARLLHRLSKARDEPFIRVNCAAIPSDLLESELFGHVKGAFSGADFHREGLLATAGSGTLFLDELTELPLLMQSKLLHVLDERAFRPLGGDQERPFQARIIAASNVNFQQAVQAGRFREDLYFRLNVMQIYIPPLRERTGDIVPLANYLLAKMGGELSVDVPALTPLQCLWLKEQDWRGNIRELKNALERAFLLGSKEELNFPDMDGCAAEGVQNLAAASRTFEYNYITEMIEQCHGDKGAAAKVLGIGLSSLYRKLDG